ncbi:MAG: cytochrome c [Verrucomicrobiota bacterium]
MVNASYKSNARIDVRFRTVARLLILSLLALAASVRAADTAEPGADKELKLIAPAVSTGTGLLLESALTLPEFTREKFAEAMATVGAEKIHKQWTSPVVTLAPHPRADAKGLTHDEVKAYMMEAKRLFTEGKAVPVSDVGLISTQEDVIRRPMLNHVSAFSNSAVRVYLLVQKTSKDDGWGYYSIVQDLTASPITDYFAELQKTGPHFEGTSCYKCHSSGPLAIHPAREDLVLDARLLAAVDAHIADQPRSQFYFPENSPKPRTGELLTLKFCARCHSEDGDRGPLYQLQSHTIRVMVDFGYMPPKRHLKPGEIAELKAWLEHKP